MTPEQKRRLDALEEATNHITYCEKDFKEYESGSYEPFSVSPWTNVSGEVNVIYDRSGNVERIVRHDDPRDLVEKIRERNIIEVSEHIFRMVTENQNE